MNAATREITLLPFLPSTGEERRERKLMMTSFVQSRPRNGAPKGGRESTVSFFLGCSAKTPHKTREMNNGTTLFPLFPLPPQKQRVAFLCVCGSEAAGAIFAILRERGHIRFPASPSPEERFRLQRKFKALSFLAFPG